ncbi:hypothetical protein [Pseudomonas sp. E141]|uniref:hypothetical protein n=1 Tax=Pseudomonas sp. E141 TaxID=2875961 RepID=UPI00404668C4
MNDHFAELFIARHGMERCHADRLSNQNAARRTIRGFKIRIERRVLVDLSWVNNAVVNVAANFDDILLEAHGQMLQTDLSGYLSDVNVAWAYLKTQKSGVD